MPDLFDTPPNRAPQTAASDQVAADRGANAHDYSVSELSGAIKRVIEGEFGLVRVRGEVGRVSRPASGHLYFDLKDDRAVIAAISWKGQVARMQTRPEEGMEVIATGRLTTFPGQSKYQLIVEEITPAGAGALMAMLERRRQALAAEGLFDAARKRPIPYLPGLIGVITSPSGAVIRDILHRLRERFPRKVLIWPVAVQGERCAPEVAAAIAGFNALSPGGRIPRPDLLIVARGGGSLEDLWGFNDEAVVRAAAASRIPLISAVGHETDTTLLDFAADLRAPTPTAAAERAVPVRMDLLAQLAGLDQRLQTGQARLSQIRGQRLRDLARALGRPEQLLAPARQRLDLMGDRLDPALRGATAARRAGYERLAGRLAPGLLAGFLRGERRALTERGEALAPALARSLAQRREALARADRALGVQMARHLDQGARARAEGAARLDALAQRLAQSLPDRLARAAESLAQLDRMRQTLGYGETLARGFALVRDDAGRLVTRAAEAAQAPRLQLQFADDRLWLAGPGEGSTGEEGRGAEGRGAEGMGTGAKVKPGKRRSDARAGDGADPQGDLF